MMAKEVKLDIPIRGKQIDLQYILYQAREKRQGESLTLTICEAAASGANPRQQSKAVSAVIASQTPSLEITSLPPAEDSCRNDH